MRLVCLNSWVRKNEGVNQLVCKFSRGPFQGFQGGLEVFTIFLIKITSLSAENYLMYCLQNPQGAASCSPVNLVNT